MSIKEIEKKEKTIVDLAKKYVRKHFKRNIPSAYKFHQYAHFKEVAKTAKKIAKKSNLDEEQTEILLLANWFRYSGITKQYENYHQISARMAAEFLTAKEYPVEKIKQVTNLILGSAKEGKPSEMLAGITYDASAAYMGKKGFTRDSNSLWVELEEVYKQEIKSKTWAQQEYDKLVKVQFYTEYANEKYQDRLADNLQHQRKLIEKAKKASIRKRTGKEFGRGIDTLYRTSYRNHINLSSIADGKANMMISINTIILSAIVTLMATGMSFSGAFSIEEFQFMVPIIILLVTVLISAIFAVLSARPKVTENSITSEDILSRKKSVLFFGNFITMRKQEFVESLDMLKRNQALLYDNMAIDMYFLGHVLDRKYRLIKHSYNIFMGGLILCVLSFIFLLIYSQLVGY